MKNARMNAKKSRALWVSLILVMDNLIFDMGNSVHTSLTSVIQSITLLVLFLQTFYKRTVQVKHVISLVKT